MKSCRKTLIALSLLALAPAAAGNLSQRDEVNNFVAQMVKQHNFNGPLLKKVFSKVALQPSIIEAMTRPAEGKPWYQYRPIFLTQSRIDGGIKFWDKHEQTLQKAEEKYGVPAEVIIAIIGVETRYGQHTGNYRVMDALATLAFDYPPRSSFFKGELEHYLLMSREEQIDPLKLKGSYAGAMGQPQFIPSSFRSYAVDFDGDGRRDLWDNTTDVIGSVANYFKRHGWKKGAPITTPVHIEGKRYKKLLTDGLKPDASLQQFRKLGIQVPKQYHNRLQAKLLEFETEDDAEYWAGLDNFYVITRYNHSALYAMAVYQLSQEIRQQRAARANQTAAAN